MGRDYAFFSHRRTVLETICLYGVHLSRHCNMFLLYNLFRCSVESLLLLSCCQTELSWFLYNVGLYFLVGP